MTERRKGIGESEIGRSIFIPGITAFFFLQEAGNEHICWIPRAWTPVRACVESDVHVREWSVCLFWKNMSCRLILEAARLCEALSGK